MEWNLNFLDPKRRNIVRCGPRGLNFAEFGFGRP